MSRKNTHATSLHHQQAGEKGGSATAATHDMSAIACHAAHVKEAVGRARRIITREDGTKRYCFYHPIHLTRAQYDQVRAHALMMKQGRPEWTVKDTIKWIWQHGWHDMVDTIKQGDPATCDHRDV